MTSPVSIPSAVRDSLDKLHELSERLLALCMMASNQEDADSLPVPYISAYFEQMGDLAGEVMGVTHRLDEDLRYTNMPVASEVVPCDRCRSPGSFQSA